MNAVTTVNNGSVQAAVYDEGLKVGYKWFDAERKAPAFSFGFRLSPYVVCLLQPGVHRRRIARGGFSVRNTGKQASQEVAQVSVSLPAAAGEPPKRLSPARARPSRYTDPLYLSVFDAAAVRWKILPGEHKVTVGPSSATLPLAATVTLEGTK